MELKEIYKIFLDSEGISTDTRSIKQGEIYFGLKGETYDGNKFALDALRKGALAVISDDSSLDRNNDIFIVNNSLQFLQSLAHFHRKSLGVPVIAITGSNGKTTTKELLYEVLSQKFKVLKTAGNFNNHIGVPLSLLRIRSDHEIAIIEMGANHPNDIQELCEIADPDIGLITNVGKAHLGEFGSFEKVVETKTEMYRYLEKKGTVFVNANNKLLKANIPNDLQVIYYFEEEVILIEKENNYLSIRYKEETIDTQLFGSYNTENIIAAIEIGKYFKVDLITAIKGIESYVPENMRSQVKVFKNTKFVLDSYNANLSSMKASLESFSKLKEEKIIILGDMLEMGIYADEVHSELQDYIDIDLYSDIIFIGKNFQDNKKIDKALYFDTLDSYLEIMDISNFQGKAVLLKGSRSMGLEKILDSF